MREGTAIVAVPEGEAKVVAIDSTKPDLDEGEVGREHYGWIDSEFKNWDRGPRIVMIHHHILAVPGTGRDVNNLRDAGDVMAILRELKVDMVLSGHRHVPYVWSISGVRIIHSGTASSMRVRGTMPPSYNVIELDEESVRIRLKQPGKGKEGEEPLASFSRKPVTTSEFYPDFERFVIFDRLPFLKPATDEPSPPASAGGPKQ
jgi:3',5'-cyclic AMP phosphodiesterase CpdA